MTSKQAKWNWSKEYQKAFDTIKNLVSRETLLSYPNFNESFEIHTDASKLQLDQKLVKKVNPLHSISGNSILHRSITLPQNVDYFP